MQAKAALICYCQKEAPAHDDYLSTSRRLSECIDNMRIVYSNVGETDDLIGLYPYSPLHRMRKTLDSLDPAKGEPSKKDLQDALHDIREAFNAIREHFLDEFDLEEPSKPILVYAMTRTKNPGATDAAQRLHDKQAAITGTKR